MLKIVQKAADIVGSITALAGELDVTPQALHQWTKVPPNHAKNIERATGGQITRHQLRPDLWDAA